jgi:hypothetical protein
MRGRELVRRVGFALFTTIGSAAGCASAPAAVRDIAVRKLHCARDQVEVSLNRETPRVREYAAGCNFMYTRVLCTDQRCAPAETKPPCIGNMPCFEEDPDTLAWRLGNAQAFGLGTRQRTP